MVALGKARLIYRAKEGEEVSYGALYQQDEEEVSCDTPYQREEMIDYQKLYEEKEKEVKDLKFELLLANVREMIHTDVFPQVLKNSSETDL